MKLKKKALAEINNPRTRSLLALGLGHTEQWIIQLIKRNDANGTLTTMAAINIIKEETKLSEKDILEQEPVTAGGQK